MWRCPKCGREFKRTNQGHYCGEAPKTVLEYVDSQPLETRSRLTEMMIILHSSVPYTNERIWWSMPYYEKEGKYISFSACKKHISFYVGAEAIEKFALDLNEFVTKKCDMLPLWKSITHRIDSKNCKMVLEWFDNFQFNERVAMVSLLRLWFHLLSETKWNPLKPYHYYQPLPKIPNA